MQPAIANFYKILCIENQQESAYNKGQLPDCRGEQKRHVHSQHLQKKIHLTVGSISKCLREVSLIFLPL